MKAKERVKEMDYFPFVGSKPNIEEFKIWAKEIGVDGDFIVNKLGDRITSLTVFVLTNLERDEWYLDSKENFFNQYETNY